MTMCPTRVQRVATIRRRCACAIYTAYVLEAMEYEISQAGTFLPSVINVYNNMPQAAPTVQQIAGAVEQAGGNLQSCWFQGI